VFWLADGERLPQAGPLGWKEAASDFEDAWPIKSVVVVVLFAASGNTDLLARIFAGRLVVCLRQQFVIENRAGASGATGVAYMTKSPADGYTLG
jgi:tripartite-type tricarboxylate transporter receptor subunit TctC